MCRVAELKKLTVEELMAIQVTSVSRTEERLGEAPAAVAVVTSENLRRSGATTVPEALRLIPGIHLARESSSAWAIGSRGFSSVNSGWRRMEISLVGQNLLHDQHAEFGEPASRGEIQRGVYGKVAWGF